MPAHQKTKLTLAVGKANDAWDLVVSVDKSVLMRKTVSPEATKNSWLDMEVDLTSFAGKTVTLDLTGEALNKAAKNPPQCRLSALSLRSE